MRKIQIFTILFLLLPPIGISCTTCNRQLQNEICNSFNLHNLSSILLVILGVAIVTMVTSKTVHYNYLRQAQNNSTIHLNPTPVLTAGIILGIGLGGFIDGIVFHQLLQWHEMLSNKIPVDTLTGKSTNMFWDGLFHLICLIMVCAGISLLWNALSNLKASKSSKLVWSGLVSGWGIFNVSEGLIDHQLFKIHNVRELAEKQEIYNLAFLIFSFALLLLGWLLYKAEHKKRREI